MGLVKSVKQYLGVLAITPPDTIVAERAPTTTDTKYRLFQIWLNDDTNDFYIYAGAGVWAAFAGSGIGIATINTQPPLVNNFTLAGTASQITATTTAHTVTFSLPSTITTPGSLTTTTFLASGSTITAGTGIVATTGNIVASTGNITTTAGSITSATTLTATLGAITATNGNLVLGTAGNKLSIATGSNASVGTTAALSGTPGTITVSTTAVTASSIILISRNTPGGTLGNLSVPSASISAGVHFIINSDANETSTVNWMIIN